MFDGGKLLAFFLLGLTWMRPAVTLSPHPKLILISFDGFRYDLLNATMVSLQRLLFPVSLHSLIFASGRLNVDHLAYEEKGRRTMSSTCQSANIGRYVGISWKMLGILVFSCWIRLDILLS